jgi:hypothetical protein
MMATLYQTNIALYLDFLVLAQWNNSPQVHMSLHLDTFILMITSQPVFALIPFMLRV